MNESSFSFLPIWHH